MAFYAGINTILKDSTVQEPSIEETIAATSQRIKMLEATIPAITIWKNLQARKNITNLDIERIIEDQVRFRRRNVDDRNPNTEIDISQKHKELNAVDSMRKLQYLMVQEKLIKKRINELQRKEQAYKNVLENLITNNVKPCLQTLKNLPPELKNICDCKKCECLICVQKNDFLAGGKKFEEEKNKRIQSFQEQQRQKFENEIKQEEEIKLKEFETRKKLKDKNDYVCIDSCWRRNIEDIAFKLSTSLNGIMKNHPDIHNSIIDQLKEVTTTVTAAAKIIKLREKHQLKTSSKVLSHNRIKKDFASDPHLCAVIDYARENQFCNMKPESPPPPNFCRLCDRNNCLHISPCCKNDGIISARSYIIESKSCIIKKPCQKICLPIKSKCSDEPPCTFVNCNDSILIRDSRKFNKISNTDSDIANRLETGSVNEVGYRSIQLMKKDTLKSDFSCKDVSCHRHPKCKLISKCNLAPPACPHIPKCCKSSTTSSCKKQLPCAFGNCVKQTKCKPVCYDKKVLEIWTDAKNINKSCARRQPCGIKKSCNIETNSCALLKFCCD